MKNSDSMFRMLSFRGNSLRQAAVYLAMAASLGLFAGRVSGVHAQAKTTASVTEQLVGSWKLMSRVSKLASGEVSVDPGLGAKPSGVLIYDASGHMAAQLSRQGRTIDMLKEECGAMAAVNTSPNTANTILGYDAYFGTYTIHEKEGFVTHHVEAALWPGNQGTDINRSFTLKGDELSITFKTTTQDGQPVTRTLVWQRIR
ncbi:MAG TPA: lipocalin-like domain-containing protein [Candidatus Angelobacter sp.]|jgi:hypothetical protein|nr:lipocalin-like domain-containing protein [Candidatus Angelobacter sp.]